MTFVLSQIALLRQLTALATFRLRVNQTLCQPYACTYAENRVIQRVWFYWRKTDGILAPLVGS